VPGFHSHPGVDRVLARSGVGLALKEGLPVRQRDKRAPRRDLLPRRGFLFDQPEKYPNLYSLYGDMKDLVRKEHNL